MDYKNLSLEELLNFSNDRAAWYWIGMAYWSRNDFINAKVWLEKTMNDQINEWADKATLNLGLLNLGLIPNASRDEALRLFEKNPNGIMSKLNAGFLYYNGTETQKDTVKGKEYIDEAIKRLIESDGDDTYLGAGECFDIAAIYAQEGIATKAIEYLKKTINRSDINYQSDRELIELAKNNLRILGG